MRQLDHKMPVVLNGGCIRVCSTASVSRRAGVCVCVCVYTHSRAHVHAYECWEEEFQGFQGGACPSQTSVTSFRTVVLLGTSDVNPGFPDGWGDFAAEPEC